MPGLLFEHFLKIQDIQENDVITAGKMVNFGETSTKILCIDAHHSSDILHDSPPLYRNAINQLFMHFHETGKTCIDCQSVSA